MCRPRYGSMSPVACEIATALTTAELLMRVSTTAACGVSRVREDLVVPL